MAIDTGGHGGAAAMTALWQWSELLATGEVRGQGDAVDVSGISIDTRSLQAGDLFVALAGDPGPRFHSSSPGDRDGHEFLDAAVKAGAAAVMVAHEVIQEVPQLIVPDTLDGLWALAAASRQRVSGQVIGITGSAGKTTMRSWMERILARYGQTHASTGSLNNHWGLPLSMARMPAASDFGVLEIGINNPGEMAQLTRLAKPDIAVVLNVLPAHVGRFAGMDELRQQKLTIAAGLDDRGALVVHDAIAGAAAARVLRFGFSSAADVRGRLDSAGRLTVDLAGKGTPVDLPVNGEHRALTALACIAVVLALDLDPAPALAALSRIDLPGGRGNEVTVADIVLVDDSYNANPVSMRYALDALNQGPAGSTGRRIAILGEMLELGDDAPAMHRDVLAAAQALDRVLTVGDGFAGLGNHEHFASTAELDVARLAGELEPGDRVLIKGSNKVFWAQGFVAQLARALEQRF